MGLKLCDVPHAIHYLVFKCLSETTVFLIESFIPHNSVVVTKKKRFNQRRPPNNKIYRLLWPLYCAP